MDQKMSCLQLKMTLVRSNCKAAGATNLTVNPSRLVVHGCSSWKFAFGILLLCAGPLYSSQDAYQYHDFCLGCICEETNLLKQSNQNIK